MPRGRLSRARTTTRGRCIQAGRLRRKRKSKKLCRSNLKGRRLRSTEMEVGRSQQRNTASVGHAKQFLSTATSGSSLRIDNLIEASRKIVQGQGSEGRCLRVRILRTDSRIGLAVFQKKFSDRTQVDEILTLPAKTCTADEGNGRIWSTGQGQGSASREHVRTYIVKDPVWHQFASPSSLSTLLPLRSHLSSASHISNPSKKLDMATSSTQHLYYAYSPSMAAAIIFAVLFGCVTAYHSYLLVRCRTWFMM